MMLSSRQNPQVKELIKLQTRKYRRRRGQFVAEGLRLVADGLAAGWQPDQLVISPPLLSQEAAGQVEQWDYPRLDLVPELMDLVGDTETSQGVMAVFPTPESTLSQLQGDLVLVLDGIRDPGNAGTLLRTAAAVGVDGVVALSGCVDLTAPKVVRASMGGIFRAPWVLDVMAGELIPWLQARGFQVVRMEPRAGIPFHQYDYQGKLALVVGSEAHGISAELAAACTDILTIPMPGGSESLNAAMAATLVLYQALIARGL